MKKMVMAAMLAALGVLTSHLIYVPVGIAKCFPMQHGVNVIAGVLFGPWYAVGTALTISMIRNLSGTGTILAFPGSMIGAYFAGLFYLKTGKIEAAALGELMGTGIFGALLAVPMANLFLGTSKAAFALVIPFAVSSLGGAMIASIVLKSTVLQQMIETNRSGQRTY